MQDYWASGRVTLMRCCATAIVDSSDGVVVVAVYLAAVASLAVASSTALRSLSSLLKIASRRRWCCSRCCGKFAAPLERLCLEAKLQLSGPTRHIDTARSDNFRARLLPHRGRAHNL